MINNRNIEWLRPKDFEEIFGIKTSTQAKMRMKRLLPFSKFGKFIYYDRHEIDDHLKGHKMETKNA
jgi:hypothetical protein